ncbi:MAG: hypothetical protein Q8L53_16755 [Aestuariivirga sp.]|nr:hypothetical protein [Aestuariivirga sp.]
MSGPYATYGRPGVSQSVAFTGTHGRIANAISPNIFLVRVVLTTAGHISIGHQGNLAATTADMYMPAGVPEYFAIRPGEKISAIRSADNGTMHVTEITN